jgi:hypothetical protein
LKRLEKVGKIQNKKLRKVEDIQVKKGKKRL